VLFNVYEQFLLLSHFLCFLNSDLNVFYIYDLNIVFFTNENYFKLVMGTM